MLSQKRCCHTSGPPPSSRVSTARGRLSQIVEAVRPTTRSAVRRRPAARGLLNARLRERDAAVRASGSRRRLGRGENFLPQTLEDKRNRIGISPNPPRSEDAGATSISPVRKQLGHRVRSRRRSREIGRLADERRRNFPIRNRLKRLEKAKESRRPSLLAPARAAVQGNAASDPSGIIPGGLPEAGADSQ